MKPHLPARLWDFSLAVYARGGVKAACLELQAAGLDVNVALWIGWVSAQGRDPRAALGEAARISALWSHRIVHPLRSARNHLKPAPGFVDADGASRLRTDILKAELQAERLEQEALDPLARLCPAAAAGPEAQCLQGLAAYADRLGVRANPDPFVESVFSALKKE